MIRRWSIWVILVCTLFACWWVEQGEQVSDTATVSRKPEVKRRVTLVEAMPDLISEPSKKTQSISIVADEPIVDLFGAMEISTAEVTEVQVTEPISPFSYAGRLQEEGRWTVFLTDGQQQYVLHEGDQFAEGWKVAALNQQKIVLQHATERFEIRLDNEVVF